MSVPTIFDKIVSGEIPSYPVWEDEKHLAFLTPFPNTDGFTVVIPKTNIGDYLFALEEGDYTDLLVAAQKVAKKLELAFSTPRVAMVVEGTGVAHVHVKLIPLHGDLASKTNVWSKHQEFYPEYIGYLTTVEGPMQSEDYLKKMQEKIRNAA